jgi:hypothetical protein
MLAMCLVLAACQAPPADTAAAALQPAAPAATQPQAPAATESAQPQRDAYYTDGRLRPAYGWCVDEAGQDAGKLAACGKDELAYQEARLADAAAKVVATLDGSAKQRWTAAQATWRTDTDRHCTAASNSSAEQLQHAQECRLFRVANRADQLLAQSAPPDTSYAQATLRPEYTRCVQEARGMDDQLEACDAAEFDHHQGLLEKQVARLMDGPDGPAKDRWMDEQADWAEDTDKRCSPATDGVAQALDAQSCRINRYANRALQLQKRELAP